LNKYRHFSELLADDELERAERFHFQKDRNEFICCRGFLRETLSNYTRIPSSEIRFNYGENGKPELIDTNEIKFNLSHSKEYALLALAEVDEIGIDIELIKEIPEMFDIANELYSENENGILKNSPKENKNIFFTFWTRKEAIIKAVGRGLSAPLKMIDISSLNNIMIDKKYQQQSNEFDGCHLLDLISPSGYKSAVAFFGSAKEISYFTI
jgi:4'-phosphopantetheinyl transferase